VIKKSRFQDLHEKQGFLKEVNVKNTIHFPEWSGGYREAACNLTRSDNISLLVRHIRDLIFFDIVPCQEYLLG
jgi:hypothetical protein